MERLTEKVFTSKDGKSEYACNASVRCTNNRLGELEDKLESGQLQEVSNKPLMIEDLKALEVGDWVWIVTPTNQGEYYQIGYSDYLEDENAFVAYSLHYGLNVRYSDYGTKWTAYKNKEAEAKLKELQENKK